MLELLEATSLSVFCYWPRLFCFLLLYSILFYSTTFSSYSSEILYRRNVRCRKWLIGTCNARDNIQKLFKTMLSTTEVQTYLAVTIWDKSGVFSGKLFLNVPAELRESWDLNDLSLPLVPKLPTLPELSEPLRRSIDGILPLSEDSISSKNKFRKYRENKPSSKLDCGKVILMDWCSHCDIFKFLFTYIKQNQPQKYYFRFFLWTNNLNYS